MDSKNNSKTADYDENSHILKAAAVAKQNDVAKPMQKEVSTVSAPSGGLFFSQLNDLWCNKY